MPDNRCPYCRAVPGQPHAPGCGAGDFGPFPPVPGEGSKPAPVPAPCWYLLRLGEGPDVVVRDDTGQAPGDWPAAGRRRFPVVAALLAQEASRHNHAKVGTEIRSLGPSWIDLAHLGRVAVPVTELPPEHALVVEIMRGMAREAAATEPDDWKPIGPREPGPGLVAV